MQIASMHFKERAHDNMGNAQLQGNLQKIKGKFVAKRRESLTELDDFEATREAGKAIRQRALDNLDVWLEIFEKNAVVRGAIVLWAETPADINAYVLDIARRHGVKKIIKSKSMVSEESALDRAIEAAGLKVLETDLGEYILQINDYEPPSHIIGPAKGDGRGADAMGQPHPLGIHRCEDLLELLRPLLTEPERVHGVLPGYGHYGPDCRRNARRDAAAGNQVRPCSKSR